MRQKMNAETVAIHADDGKADADVAPSMSVSTTFRYPEGFNENAAIDRGHLEGTKSNLPDFNIYSRHTSTTRTRVERVLGDIQGGLAVTYSSGLSALFAIFESVQPKTIVISKGYHGTQEALELYTRNRNVMVIFEDECTKTMLQDLKAGDLVLIESPQNPYGIIADIPMIIENVRDDVIVAVDGTFCPPPLQQLLDLKTAKRSVDIVMHSCTKALGGHSDMLGGVLVTKSKTLHSKLLDDRLAMGTVMGNFESWLLLRSLRTLKLRVTQQSNSAAYLANWLNSKSEPSVALVTKVWHASLPSHPGHYIAKRDCTGWSGVLSIELQSPLQARLLVRSLELFANATSLGVSYFNRRDANH